MFTRDCRKKEVHNYISKSLSKTVKLIQLKVVELNNQVENENGRKRRRLTQADTIDH